MVLKNRCSGRRGLFWAVVLSFLCFFGPWVVAQDSRQAISEKASSAGPIPTPAIPYGTVWETQTYKLPAANIVRVKGNRVYPHPNIPLLYELVAIEGEEAIIRSIPPEDPDSPHHRAWLLAIGEEARLVAQREYLKDKFLVMEMPDPPQDFVERLAWREAEGEFPRGGQWQMSFDLGDFNNDGRVDLVLPPARGGVPFPTILLQNQGGSFQRASAVFPADARLDYGAVRAVDFDGNGTLDLALACHFGHHVVLYNSGGLRFERFTVLPVVVEGVTARSLTVADFNRDGRPDLASLAELDISFKTQERFNGGLVNIFLNLPSGWKATSSDRFSKGIMGDWISSGDLNGDGLADLFLTSRGQGIMDLVFLNQQGGANWRNIAPLKMPVNAFSFANALGRFDNTSGRDLVLCFEQFNPKVQEDPTQACVIYHFHDAKGKFTEDPRPQVLFKEKQAFKNYEAVAVGDLDGDKRDDIVVGSMEGQVRVFLQLAPGRFFENRPDLRVNGPVVDIKVADFNKDGIGDLAVMATTGQLNTNGGVWVFYGARKGKA